jgi:hypothetical protein
MINQPLDKKIHNKDIECELEGDLEVKDVKSSIQRIIDEIIMTSPNRRQNLIKLRKIVGEGLLEDKDDKNKRPFM